MAGIPRTRGRPAGEPDIRAHLRDHPGRQRRYIPARPLLVTGPPGSGKSSIAESVAYELRLGPVLRWHVTSHSTLEEAVFRYDALGRLQDNQLHSGEDDITKFLRLGPLGTALLGAGLPRVLLIDELDKGELDLPSSLLNVLERGEYEIPELNRLGEGPFRILWGSKRRMWL